MIPKAPQNLCMHTCYADTYCCLLVVNARHCVGSEGEWERKARGRNNILPDDSYIQTSGSSHAYPNMSHTKMQKKKLLPDETNFLISYRKPCGPSVALPD